MKVHKICSMTCSALVLVVFTHYIIRVWRNGIEPVVCSSASVFGIIIYSQMSQMAISDTHYDVHA